MVVAHLDDQIGGMQVFQGAWFIVVGGPGRPVRPRRGDRAERLPWHGCRRLAGSPVAARAVPAAGT